MTSRKAHVQIMFPLTEKNAWYLRALLNTETERNEREWGGMDLNEPEWHRKGLELRRNDTGMTRNDTGMNRNRQFLHMFKRTVFENKHCLHIF